MAGRSNVRDGAIMDDSGRGFVDGLQVWFGDVSDPRVVGRCDHRLLDIIAIAILAVLCGAEDFLFYRRKRRNLMGRRHLVVVGNGMA